MPEGEVARKLTLPPNKPTQQRTTSVRPQHIIFNRCTPEYKNDRVSYLWLNPHYMNTGRPEPSADMTAMLSATLKTFRRGTAVRTMGSGESWHQRGCFRRIAAPLRQRLELHFEVILLFRSVIHSVWKCMILSPLLNRDTFYAISWFCSV